MTATINIALKKGVLDSAGKATHHTLDTLGFSSIVEDIRIGKQITMKLDTNDKDEAKKQVTKMCEDLLANTVIEDYEIILEA
jgi:phosphoribosylformylglycinamidine synthase